MAICQGILIIFALNFSRFCGQTGTVTPLDLMDGETRYLFTVNCIVELRFLVMLKKLTQPAV